MAAFISRLVSSPEFRQLPPEERRRALYRTVGDWPFSLLMQFIPVAELGEIFGASATYLLVKETLDSSAD